MSSVPAMSVGLTRRARHRPNRPGQMLGWFSLALTVGALARAGSLIIAESQAAWSIAGWSRPDFVAVSAVPALLLLPLFFVAFLRSRAARYRRCGEWLAWALFLLVLFVVMPRGVYSAGWYAVPLIVLLVSCMFGVASGLAQASIAVFVLLVAAALTVRGGVLDAALLQGAWLQAAAAGTVVVAMALAGTLLHRTLNLAISAEEDQQQRMDEAMRALRHRENLLRHAMRVDTVGEMSSMVVHQLRNQFQLIMGYAAAGMRRSDDKSTGHFRSIVATLGQSNDLLEDLLGMTRREGGEVETVDLTELCEQVCEQYRKVLPANIRFEFVSPQRPIPVLLDRHGLEHALLNLVINARQAITGGGAIRLRLEQHEQTAVLRVSDTGSGIPPEHLDQVFKPFFTTKQKGEGTGLGLAAVHRFVVASNGEVRVHSEPGAGTTFTMVFPLESA